MVVPILQYISFLLSVSSEFTLQSYSIHKIFLKIQHMYKLMLKDILSMF